MISLHLIKRLFVVNFDSTMVFPFILYSFIPRGRCYFKTLPVTDKKNDYEIFISLPSIFSTPSPLTPLRSVISPPGERKMSSNRTLGFIFSRCVILKHTDWGGGMPTSFTLSIESQKGVNVFKDVPLRTRRAIWLYKFYGDCAFLVLNGKSLNNINALLALNRLYFYIFLYIFLIEVVWYFLVPFRFHRKSITKQVTIFDWSRGAEVFRNSIVSILSWLVYDKSNLNRKNRTAGKKKWDIHSNVLNCLFAQKIHKGKKLCNEKGWLPLFYDN